MADSLWTVIIRPYDQETDSAGLRACVVALQEYERRIDPRMIPGDSIADDYILDMSAQCEELDGTVLVAESDGVMAGYVMVLCRVSSGDLDDGNIEFGLISDLMVMEQHRSEGAGRALIQAAEQVARDNGVKWLRINVLAANTVAVGLYESLGFEAYTIDLEKSLATQH